MPETLCTDEYLSYKFSCDFVKIQFFPSFKNRQVHRSCEKERDDGLSEEPTQKHLLPAFHSGRKKLQKAKNWALQGCQSHA